MKTAETYQAILWLALSVGLSIPAAAWGASLGKYSEPTPAPRYQQPFVQPPAATPRVSPVTTLDIKALEVVKVLKQLSEPERQVFLTTYRQKLESALAANRTQEALYYQKILKFWSVQNAE